MGVPGWCPPASLSSIKRGLGTERARLGTFRGFATERARLGIFRGFGTERARLGTFRGFLIFFFKTSKFDPKSPLVIVKLGVDFRKTVLPAQIFHFFFWTKNGLLQMGILNQNSQNLKLKID